MRLIDADALYKVLFEEAETAKCDTVASGMALANHIAQEQPTIDAEPVRHGRWVKMDGANRFWCYCSECTYATDPYPYCPHCGAKMENGRR